MKVTLQEQEGHQALLTIEVEEERLQQAMRGAARRLSNERQVPGFRKGRAPYHIVERTFGREAILSEALEELAPQAIQEALKEKDIVPVGPPKLNIPSREPLVLEVNISLPPRVDLGNYGSLRVPPEEAMVEESQVEAALKAIQTERGEWMPVERPVQFGDQVVLDMECLVGDDTIFDARERTFTPEQELPFPAPGFSEKLVGMEADGEEKEFTLTVPSDFQDERLAGKETTWRVTLYDVKELRLPELDDEFAMTVGDFEGLENLKAKVHQQLETQAKQAAQERFLEKALDALTQGATIHYPELFVDERVEEMVKEQEEQLKARGFTLQRYLEMMGQSETQLREELRPRARKRLERALALGKLAELEGLKVEEQEMEERVEAIAQAFGSEAQSVRQDLSSEKSRENILNRLLTDKVISRLLEIVSGEEKAPAAVESLPQSDAAQREGEHNPL